MRKTLLILATSICAISISGCAMNRALTPEAIRTFYCGTDAKPGAYVPVRYSRHDTPETIVQVKANNAVYDATCP